MLKEIKYFIFTLIIFLFIGFTTRYYFSDTNKKNSFRSLNDKWARISIQSHKKNEIIADEIQKSFL